MMILDSGLLFLGHPVYLKLAVDSCKCASAYFPCKSKKNIRLIYRH